MQQPYDTTESRPITQAECELLSQENWENADPVSETLSHFLSFPEDKRERFWGLNPRGKTTYEAGWELYDLGFNLLPLQRHSGTPVFPDWGYLNSSRLPWSVVEQALPGNNLAVIVGRTSHNLFIIECFDDQKFQELVERLGEWAKWIVETPNSNQIWFLSKDGEMKNSDPRMMRTSHPEDTRSRKYRVLGNRSFVAIPPSVGEDGSLYVWKKREGNFPPLISQAELHAYVPGIWLRHANQPKQVNNHEDVPTIGKHWNILNKPDVAALIAWSVTRPWHGKFGATDQTVFNWCCVAAANLSVEDFHSSLREMALNAGISEKTVRASLKRLSASGLIGELGSEGERGSKYKILVDLNNYHTVTSDFNISGVVLDGFANHEAWHAWALGKGGKQIYDYLHVLTHDGPGISFEDLRNGTGKAQATVKNHLEELNILGLVYLEDGKWKAADANIEKLDEIALFYHTNGANERKAQRYQKERKQFAGRLSQRRSGQGQ